MKLMMMAMAFGAALAAFAGDAYEIGEAMAGEAFWKSDPVLFVKKHQENAGFKFTSDAREGADSRRDGGVTCFGLPVYESRISFAGESGVSRVELMLYNNGGTESVEVIELGDKKVRHLERNEKKITREEFFKTLNDVRAKLTAKGKPPKPQDERTESASVHQKSQTWPKTAQSTQSTLSWNYVQEGKKTETFRPGFIRLAVDGPSALAEKKDAKNGQPKSITDNVVRDPRGDVFIDNVPMVDQGMKGYCAVAAAERVMRYYGLDVDEHQIAEAAGTTAEGGTSTREMKESVERIGKRYRLKTQLFYGDFEKSVGERIENLTKEVANYNKAAKKLKKGAITEDMYVKRSGNVISYDVAAVDKMMDAEVRREMKVNGAQKSKFTAFRQNVKQSVDAGAPLFWGVTLGIYPEEDLLQARGGHMRLIIGYNEKKNEIIYTDTWGKGHELKRMPMSWAWTISRCLMAMKPIK